MKSYVASFAGLVAYVLFTASLAGADTLTATSASYDLSGGANSTLTASGNGFDFTIHAAQPIGPLTINYGSPLITTIIQYSNSNPPEVQVTVGGMNYNVYLFLSSGSITTVPSPYILNSGEPSMFSVPAVANFLFTACIPMGLSCASTFPDDISISLPGVLAVSLTPNSGEQNSYTISDESFVSTPEPASVVLLAIGLPLTLWIRKGKNRTGRTLA